MDLKKIQSLLEKYYNGESTTQEEEILKEYFQKKDVDPKFEFDKDIFVFNSSEKKKDAALPDISDEIWENIKRQEVKLKKSGNKRFNYAMLRIAAGFVILFSSYFLLKNYIFTQSESIQYTDTYTNPEDAYNETKKTLLYVSQMLNSGADHLEPIQKIEQGARKLKSLSSFNEGLKELDPIKKYKIADKYIKK